MDLSLYVDRLRQQLAVAVDAEGAETQALADRLAASLEAAARLVLLEALSSAADEITRELAPGAVELRLRGSDPEFVVIPAPAEGSFEPVPESRGPTRADEEGATSRLNLRLPEGLKSRIEQASTADGLSLNAWLVRAAAAALEAGPRSRRSPGRSSGGERYTGWVR